MELFVYYILPNIVLFSSLYMLAKLVERSVWWFVENYTALLEMFDLRNG